MTNNGATFLSLPAFSIRSTAKSTSGDERIGSRWLWGAKNGQATFPDTFIAHDRGQG